METTLASTPPESVRLFLKDRDVPCPGCGYNLRGIESSACPECGRQIELALSHPGRSRGFLLFVLLALGWVMLAGGMNSVRTWQRVEAEAAPIAQRLMTFSSLQIRSNLGGTTTRTLTTTAGPIVTLNSNGGITISAKPPAPGNALVWSQVSTDAWLHLGWWTGLGILAIVLLVIALIRRRRFAGDVPPRGLVIGAACLFALYAGYHLIVFSRDYIA